MKRRTNCLFLSARNILSLLMPVLFVVGLVLSLQASIDVTRDLIFVDKRGDPLELRPFAEARSEGMHQLLEVCSDLDWKNDPARLAEFDRLSSRTGFDGNEAQVVKSPPCTKSLPAPVELTPKRE